MTIECEDEGFIPYEINPDDQFQVSFDIETWLGADTIASVVYSAVDDAGADATATVLDADSHANTDTVIQPYITGGVDGTKYTIKMLVTTTDGDVKAFYIVFVCDEKTS